MDMRIYERQFCQCNILRTAAGTTGFCGGDAGHGGRTIIELEDLGGTCMEWVSLHPGHIRIEFGGDSELETLIDALEFMLKTLRRQAGERRVHDQA